MNVCTDYVRVRACACVRAYNSYHKLHDDASEEKHGSAYSLRHAHTSVWLQ